MLRSSHYLLVATALGLLFLYAPMAAMVVFSFNESKLVTVWSGFSTKWYAELWQDQQVLQAAWVSLRIAAASATLAVLLGALAAMALTRVGNFRSKSLLSGMITGPLVMPEVITGLSLLLLFVAMEAVFGWPSGRGFTTIIIAHTTFGAAFVAVVVQSRLSSLDTALEEAAQDLGARPARVFLDVTLPVIAPALISGWLLAFTLSLDDLVIASFVTGPGASTLPVLIFSKLRLGVSPDINALASLMIFLVASGIAIATWLLLRKPKTLAP